MKAHITTDWLTGVLAVVTPVILALAAIATIAAGESPAGPSATLHHDNGDIVITGGSGAQAWTLRYPRIPNDEIKDGLVLDGDERAWFSNGCWLRLLETRKGVVLGRWRFPGQVLKMTPQKGQLQVEL